MTLPATASGWATAKPWECFNAGTICFAHPDYDTQDHIYNRGRMGDELYSFLRVATMTGMKHRLENITPEDWNRYAAMQYGYLQAQFSSLDGGYGHVRDAINTVAREQNRSSTSEYSNEGIETTDEAC